MKGYIGALVLEGTPAEINEFLNCVSNGNYGKSLMPANRLDESEMPVFPDMPKRRYEKTSKRMTWVNKKTRELQKKHPLAQWHNLMKKASKMYQVRK